MTSVYLVCKVCGHENFMDPFGPPQFLDSCDECGSSLNGAAKVEREEGQSDE